jgi:acetyltransferase
VTRYVDQASVRLTPDGRIATQAVVTNSENQPDRSRPYPKEWERRLLLPDGTHILVRPVRPDDDGLFRNFAKGLTDQDARLRFFVPKRELSDADLDRLVHIDYERAMAFIAIEESSGMMIGVVRLHSEPNRDSREFAITVRTDFQGHGVGRMLMQLIIDYARSLGLRVIEGRALHENKTILKMCREFGFEFLVDPEDARVTIVRLSLFRRG